jgi:hypothetical protein
VSEDDNAANGALCAWQGPGAAVRAEFNAFCEGGLNFNGFYGFGTVDAFAAVTAPPAWDELP